MGVVQVPFTKEGKLVEGGIAEHTEQCIKNLGNVLAAAGTSWEKVVKVNVYLKNMDDFGGMNQVYERVNLLRLEDLPNEAHAMIYSYSRTPNQRGLASKLLSYPPMSMSRSSASLPCKSPMY